MLGIKWLTGARVLALITLAILLHRWVTQGI